MNQKSKYPFHILAKPIGPICNLDCEYCFYLDKKDEMFSDVSNFKIPDDTLEKFIKSYIEAQPDQVQEINFAWQGGEPTLMGVDFFQKVLELQKKYKPNNKRIVNAMQTNGTLLDDTWGEFLHKNNFLIGISIDGPRELHDKYRKCNDGSGSFDDVMKGLEILKKHKVEFNILTVVQSDNSRYPEKVYRFLKSTGAKYFQFIPIVEPDATSKKKVSRRSVTPERWGNFLNKMFDLWIKKDTDTIYVQHFHLMIEMAMGYPSSLCVHSPVCGRAVALEHNGNIYSCDHFVFPEYFLGNINTDSIIDMVDGDMQMKFGQDKYDKLPQHCLDCKYLKICYGGCPSHRLIRTPDNKPGLNYLCEGYKMFYKHSEKYIRALAKCGSMRAPLSHFKKFLNVR